MADGSIQYNQARRHEDGSPESLPMYGESIGSAMRRLESLDNARIIIVRSYTDTRLTITIYKSKTEGQIKLLLEVMQAEANLVLDMELANI
jgi:hypothetical protein